MEYRPFQNISLSRLGMGIMRLPQTPDGNIDYEKSKTIIDRAYAGGINYYDTAYIYHNGKSEEFTGKALADYPRHSYYIADKFNYQANPDYKEQFAQQLQRLGTDYIDFYLIHGVQDNFVDDVLSCGCIVYFRELKEIGRIRYLGFSFHGNELSMRKMLTAGPWDFVQIQLNYYDWEYGNQQALYRMLEAQSIPVMVMEPVHGGLLARLNKETASFLRQKDPSRSAASWAMRWVKNLPSVQVVLSGMGDLNMVDDNLNTFSEATAFTPADQQTVREAAALLRPSVSLPCTVCRYCIPHCPMQLDIPTLLRSYNDMQSDSAWRLINLFGLPEEKQPSACIGCGACTRHCPQSLSVPHAMMEMTEKMIALK